MKANLLSLLCLLGAGAVSADTDIYVSPSGSDSGSGSQSSPYKSLTKAQQAVRSALGSSSSGAITVHLGSGTHTLTKPLVLTSDDSGSSDTPVVWTSSANATISGGLKITGWKLGRDGVYSASVPPNTYSRNLYVDGWAVVPARKMINRRDFKFSDVGMSWTNTAYDYLKSVRNISKAEVRFINSFTNRIAPIVSLTGSQLTFNGTSWNNNIQGYDTVNHPFVEHGVWIQNAYDLFSDGGQFFLDTDANTVYYKPLDGQDMSQVEAYLGIQEALVVVGGTYDDPAHDITFSGINFAHTTWLRPGQGYGYADQQTGGYMPAIKNYTDFEASRGEWWQMPSAVQVSAAHNIQFTKGTFWQLGAGGVGIGGDPNAHVTGTGYGANKVSVTGCYFTQVMGNSITAGGTNPNAHHPKDTRMINRGISIQENIFYNTSSLYPSTVPIFASYVQYSDFTNNDISQVPYSGFCIGYGWGLVDAGGSPLYQQRGTYKYWPVYDTPTTSMNNVVHGNLIQNFGNALTDLGGIYTLGKSPGTYITENHIQSSRGYAVYTDEGTNSHLFQRNNQFGISWLHANEGGLFTTGNNTFQDNIRYNGADVVDFANGTAPLGHTYQRNYWVRNLNQTTALSAKVGWRAGIPPAKRAGHPVANSNNSPDAAIELEFPSSGNGAVLLRVSNFDDVDFTSVKISASITPSTNFTLSTVSVPSSIPANSFAVAKYKVTGSPCTPPNFQGTVTYTNPRTSTTKTLTISGVIVGLGVLDSKFSTASTTYATFGQTCKNLGIRSSNRDTWTPNDDWSVIKTNSISTKGSIAAKVLSVDQNSGRAGVVARNSLVPFSNTTGYAEVVVTGSGGISFRWDDQGVGRLTNQTVVSGIKAPVCVRLDIDDNNFTPFYSTDCQKWSSVSNAVTVPGRKEPSEVGLIGTANSVTTNSTALFTLDI
ncbi:uncharacterized protein FFB14_11436 [Fusarium fujikuroi]|nr:uncharacterized protein FFB14_11436 [Fusarium fujikuroi]